MLHPQRQDYDYTVMDSLVARLIKDATCLVLISPLHAVNSSRTHLI